MNKVKLITIKLIKITRIYFNDIFSKVAMVGLNELNIKHEMAVDQNTIGNEGENAVAIKIEQDYGSTAQSSGLGDPFFGWQNSLMPLAPTLIGIDSIKTEPGSALATQSNGAFKQGEKEWLIRRLGAALKGKKKIDSNEVVVIIDSSDDEDGAKGFTPDAHSTKNEEEEAKPSNASN